MTLGTMRELGVQRLVAYCLNDACRQYRIDRRTELAGRDGGAVVQEPGGVREVRKPGQPRSHRAADPPRPRRRGDRVKRKRSL
jgi:hypothetical protein